MSSQNQNTVYDQIEQAVKFIFSWVILMPIAVIVGGKFLSQVLPQFTGAKQLLRIAVKGIMEVAATDNEVIYGFGGFILTLFIVSVYGGNEVYPLVKSKFGIDPGHFNSLCVFCSFANVVWSFGIFIMNTIFVRIYRLIKGDTSAERDRLLDQIAKKK